MMLIKTVPFGELEADETSDFEYLDTETVLNGKKSPVNISFADFNLYAGKLEGCIGFLNKYAEADKIAREAIRSAFTDNETVSDYFECHFDILDEAAVKDVFGVETFDDFKIGDAVKKLPAPDLMFGYDAAGNMEVSVDYRAAKDISDEILCVKMDLDRKVLDFSHES